MGFGPRDMRTTTLGALWDHRSCCCPRRAAVKVKVKVKVKDAGVIDARGRTYMYMYMYPLTTLTGY